MEVSLFAEPEHNRIAVLKVIASDRKTGVEMEALTAVSVAALTIWRYVCKAVKDMKIDGIRLLKTGR